MNKKCLFKLVLSVFISLAISGCGSEEDLNQKVGALTRDELINRFKESVINDDYPVFRSCFFLKNDDDEELLVSLHKTYNIMFQFEAFIALKFGDHGIVKLNNTTIDGGRMSYPVDNVSKFLTSDVDKNEFVLPSALFNKAKFEIKHDELKSRYYILWEKKFDSKRYVEALKTLGSDSVYYQNTVNDLKDKDNITIEELFHKLTHYTKEMFKAKYSKK